MNDFKTKFIDFILEHEILKFGNFVLKSGRKSPYFFNTGSCNNGKSLSELISFYCSLITNEGLEFDFIFGPAYKGIPLSTAISINLYTHYKIIKPYSFNRKEIKTHGDVGEFVGHSPFGNALVVDDVISSGKSIIESIKLLKKSKATCKYVVVAFDRMEVGEKNRASFELKNNYGIEIFSIITLDDIVSYLTKKNSLKHYLKLMEDYVLEYKC